MEEILLQSVCVRMKKKKKKRSPPHDSCLEAALRNMSDR